MLVVPKQHVWHFAIFKAQRMFQSVACTGCALLAATAASAAVDMRRLYLQADIKALAALQQRYENAEAAKATLEQQAQAANELCSTVQRRLLESQQANKSLRCQLHEQEQVAQVRCQNRVAVMQPINLFP